MKRLYVLTRKDLGLAYQAVQGAHAVAQFGIDYSDHEWNNGYLIFLEVEDRGELHEWLGELEYLNKFKAEPKKAPFSIFKEPDLDNELTAIAAYTNGTKFRKLPIMGSEEMPDETVKAPEFDLVAEAGQLPKPPKKPTPAPIRVIKEGESEPSGT